MSVPETAPAGAASSAPGRWAYYLLGLLFLGIYGPVFIQFLIPRWLTDESATHGWLVIPIAAVVTWYKREKLRRIPLSTHVGGLWVVALALLMHTAEKALDINGPSPLSIPIFVAGAVWYLAGTAWLRELCFPIAYLLFMVPVPGGLTQVVSFPLRLLATNGSKAIVAKFGVVVYGAGMNMEFMQPRGNEYVRILVADPCSGLHSLMAIKALHAITAYLSRLKLGWKWVLFFCALPITLASNVCRMTLIILVCAYIDKDFGLKVFHDYSPYVLFLFVFAILISIGRLMEWLTGGGRWWKARQEAQKARLADEPVPAGYTRVGRAPNLTRPLILMGVVCALSLWLGSRTQVPATPADVSQITRQAGAWRFVGDMPADPETMKQIEADSFIHRRYVRDDGQIVEMMVVYRRYGRREFAHRPDQCYPAGGYVGVSKSVTTLPWAGREDSAVYWLFDGRNVQRQDGATGVPMTTVTYFFVSGNRSESDFIRQQLWMAFERIMPNKNGWTFVRLATPRLTTDADALAAQKDFMRAMEGDIRRVITTDPATAGKAGN